MKEKFTDHRFQQRSLDTITLANEIIEPFLRQGYKMTLRQLFYQFVARGHIENTEREYTNLGNRIRDGRKAGLIDWDAIEDRTRNVVFPPDHRDPGTAITIMSRYFSLDPWAHQSRACEVWIEKEALVGVISDACERLRVPYFANRGYSSWSAAYEAGGRVRTKPTTIFALGDHDPSGIDMIREIQDRLSLLSRGADIVVERLALNIDQVRELNPAPNPVKKSDTRSRTYIKQFGPHSWELDVLDPETLNTLITNAIEQHIDRAKWDAVMEEEQDGRRRLRLIAAEFGDDE